MSSQENGRRIIRTALLTVGSTEFTALVQSALSEAVLQELQAQGCGRFIVQHGKSRLTGNGTEIVKQWSGRMIIELYEFIGDIEERMKGADLVLSHAGAGSILAALRGPALSPKTSDTVTQLVIVPNDTLMDAHQTELAQEMVSKGWAIAATPSTLVQRITELPSLSKSISSRSTLFPAFDPSRISRILDEQMGFM